MSRKNRKRTKDKKIKVAKVASIDSSWDHQTRVHEITAEDGSSQVFNMTFVVTMDLDGSIAPLPEVPLRELTTVSATADMRISITSGTTINESGAHFEAPHAENSWSGNYYTQVYRYSLVYFIDALGTMHMY